MSECCLINQSQSNPLSPSFPHFSVSTKRIVRSTVIARCVMAPGGSPKRGNVDPAQRKGGKRSAREGQIKPSTPRLLLLSFLLSLIPHEIGL